MRITVLALLLGLAGCDDRDGESNTQPDAGGVQVSGCDDPAVWTSPVAHVAEGTVDVGAHDDVLGTAQFPLRTAFLGLNPKGDPFEYEYGRVCWRVTEASPGSGWTAGQTFSSTTTPAMNVIGFARPVTVEGRVLATDNTLVVAIEPTKIELHAPVIVEPAASAVIAVMSADAWAERDAVHLWGQRIPTDEVLDAASIRTRCGNSADPVTLHRVGGTMIRRTWSRRSGSIEYTDLVIGPGTTGRLTTLGNAALVDNELVIFGYAGQDRIVSQRIALDATPLEMVEDGYDVTLHLPGELVSVRLFAGTSATLPVGDGALVSASRLPPFFFDGTSFHRISRSNTSLAFEQQVYTPGAEDLARLGKPVAEMDSVFIGEGGFLATNFWQPWEAVTPGPGAATFAEIFGDGHLGPLSSDNAAYVVVHDNGSAELYAAPYSGYCDPI
ncbi:MAG: hypothetical protein HOV81_25045 [Kofleriaceae bacterium]|nr:hypothetical protein [Kofleriaceae bacterium]